MIIEFFVHKPILSYHYNIIFCHRLFSLWNKTVFFFFADLGSFNGGVLSASLVLLALLSGGYIPPLVPAINTMKFR